MTSKNNILKGILLALFSIFLVLNLNLIIYVNAIKGTVLNPNFFEKELEELNFYSLLKEKLISSEALTTISGGDKRIQKILEESITEEWIKKQINYLLYGFFSYINSESEELNLKVSTVEVKENLLKSMRREIGKFLPPPIAGDEKQIDLYLNQLKEEFDKNIPDEFSLLNMVEDENAKEEFKENLNQVREAVSYLHNSFYLLIVSVVILILLIIILARELKSILRRIGASFFISGSSLYLGNFLALQMVSSRFTPEENLPQFISQDMLLKILNDIFSGINFWGMIFMGLGVLMIIGSFLVKEGKKRRKR
jgi:hypothetical protein